MHPGVCTSNDSILRPKTAQVPADLWLAAPSAAILHTAHPTTGLWLRNLARWWRATAREMVDVFLASAKVCSVWIEFANPLWATSIGAHLSRHLRNASVHLMAWMCWALLYDKGEMYSVKASQLSSGRSKQADEDNLSHSLPAMAPPPYIFLTQHILSRPFVCRPHFLFSSSSLCQPTSLPVRSRQVCRHRISAVPSPSDPDRGYTPSLTHRGHQRTSL